MSDQEVKKGRSKNETQVVKDKKVQKSKLRNVIKSKFKSIDAFGQSVSLTINGDDQFKTTFGAAVTAVLGFILFAYFVYRSYYLVNRFNPNVIKTSLIRNVSEVGEFYPAEYGFDFAFGLRDPLDPSIGYYTLRQIYLDVDEKASSQGKSVRNRTIIDLPMAQCGTENFWFDD